MSEKLIEIKNLKVIYETDEEIVQAVNGINLTVNKGETLGLVGETGAGKTTLALSIMGLLPDKIGFIKEGEILFNGIDLTKAKEGDLRLIRGEHISMIFQDPMTSLNPILTVGEQISEVLELHRRELNKEQIDK
ncbi:MAG: ABC transporter ATP-binding protein, partial [Tissierellia bacterium]|nr:ABC transporter ATP-binding protein [Tissierellia bacterium]